MRTVARRVLRLENRLQLSGNPRQRFRMVVTRMDRRPSLEGARCQRSLCPDGTLLEMVRLDRSVEGRGELADAELDRWVAGFPVQHCAAAGSFRWLEQ
jgi:hypothetical protein